jgi:dihydrofolate reductase
MKTLMYLTMTLNGYIATENDESPWPKEVWQSYYAISKKYKVVIVGRKTYEIMDKISEFKKIGNPFVIVLSKKKTNTKSNVIFLDSPKKALGVAKKMGFKKILISGGGILNTSMIKEGLVDELYIDIVPLLFGKGVKLFKEDNFETKLKLTSTKKLSDQVIQLRYKIIK